MMLYIAMAIFMVASGMYIAYMAYDIARMDKKITELMVEFNKKEAAVSKAKES